MKYVAEENSKVGQMGQPQHISIAYISLPTLATPNKKKVCLTTVSVDLEREAWAAGEME